MSQQSQTEENAFTLSGRKTGVQKRESIHYVDDSGGCHYTYADAYRASVRKKLLQVISNNITSNIIADAILNEFVVAFK